MSLDEAYEAAWSDRRRRFIAFRAAQIATVPWGVAVALALDRGSMPSPTAMAAAWMFGSLVPYAVAGVWLNAFRCPRATTSTTGASACEMGSRAGSAS